MRSTTKLASGWTSFACIMVVLVAWFSAFPTPVQAQTGAQGQNAVYNSSNGIVGSSAFIDAGVFASNPPQRNICAVLNYILVHVVIPPTYPNGAVIDARGVPGISPLVSMTCTSSPWAGITNPPPSVILLPAGTILIPGTWVLPNNTTLIGEGDDSYPPPAMASTTTLQACLPSINNCSFTGTDMLDLGTAPSCPPINGVPTCNNVSVEHLALDGQGQSLNGIVNSNAQTGSHVDHVRLYQIRGTGLWLEGNAFDSGPYSNITFDTGSFSGTTQTVCANINEQTSTRGFHNLTCISETNDAPAAVLLDSSNNSLEDVRIVGFYDGIRVGANANAQSNVLLSVIGDSAFHSDTPAAISLHPLGWATI